MSLKRYNKSLPAEVFGPDTEGAAIAHTARAAHYVRFMENVRFMMNDPEYAQKLEAENLRIKQLQPGNTQTVPLLQEMSLMYEDDTYIGYRLMPVVPVSESEGLTVQVAQHDWINKRDYPTDVMPANGKANEASENVTLNQIALAKYSLKEGVDIWNANMMPNVVGDLIDPTQNVLNGMEFNREVRIATILMNAGNFGANTAAVLAADRWNTPGGGNPGGVVDTAIAAIDRAGPGSLIAYCDDPTYRALKRNPVVLDTFKYSGQAPRFATRQMLAEFFEVDELLVGKAPRNTAQEGLANVRGDIWSVHVFGVLWVPSAPGRRSAGFGVTLAQPRTQLSWTEPGTGGKGRIWSQVATAEVHTIQSAISGFLITTPI